MKLRKVNMYEDINAFLVIYEEKKCHVYGSKKIALKVL